MKRTDRDNHREVYRAIVREERIVRAVVVALFAAGFVAATSLAWWLW